MTSNFEIDGDGYDTYEFHRSILEAPSRIQHLRLKYKIYLRCLQHNLLLLPKFSTHLLESDNLECQPCLFVLYLLGNQNRRQIEYLQSFFEVAHQYLLSLVQYLKRVYIIHPKFLIKAC